MLWPIDRHHVVRRQYQHGQRYTGKRYEARPWLCDHVCGSSRLLRCRNGNPGNAQIESPRERLCFVSGIDRPRASLILLRGSWHQNAPSRPDSAGEQPPSLVLSDLEMQMADTVALLPQARNDLMPKWPNMAVCRSPPTAPGHFSQHGFPGPPDWHGSRRPRQGPLSIPGTKQPREPETAFQFHARRQQRETGSLLFAVADSICLSASLVFGDLTTAEIPGAGRREALPPSICFPGSPPAGVPPHRQAQWRANGWKGAATVQRLLQANAMPSRRWWLKQGEVVELQEAGRFPSEPLPFTSLKTDKNTSSHPVALFARQGRTGRNFEVFGRPLQ